MFRRNIASAIDDFASVYGWKIKTQPHITQMENQWVRPLIVVTLR
jgi:hypothetical protein